MPSKSILIAIAIFHCQCTPFLVKGEKKIFHAKESYPPYFETFYSIQSRH